MSKESVFNLFSVLTILATLIICMFLGYLFINPTSVLNPLAPNELPELIIIPTATWAPPGLPDIVTRPANSDAVLSTATKHVLLPSSTPLPTRTSFVLPTATMTLTPTATATETPTVTPTNSAYQCQVVSSYPDTSRTLPPGGDFDGRWTIINTGTEAWEASVDLVYISGTKFQSYADAVDLPKTVNKNESVDVIVDMLAPREAGTYETKWSLRKNDLYFCEVTMTIKVQ